MSRESSTENGIREAWDFWLSQHPISVAAIVEKAAKEAVTAWLDANREQIIMLLTHPMMTIEARQPRDDGRFMACACGSGFDPTVHPTMKETGRCFQCCFPSGEPPEDTTKGNAPTG
jgi:hypothetical protein